MKTKITLSILLTAMLFACTKEDLMPLKSSNSQGSIDLVVTVIDNQTGNPISGADVTVEYGFWNSDTYTTWNDGKAYFSTGGVVPNTIRVIKEGYCSYTSYPDSANYSSNLIIGLDHFAYLRYHVKNLPPSASSDILGIWPPNDAFSIYGYHFLIYGANVDTTYIIPSGAGNLNIAYEIYSGSTLINTSSVNVTAIIGDTVDVNINY